SSRRRHTRWPRDWSSDVCSSDLSACIFADDIFCQHAPQAFAPEFGPKIQALHLADFGLQLVQSHASCQLAFIQSEPQAAIGWLVVARKPGQFLVEILEAQAEAKRAGVFEKKLADLRDLCGRFWWRYRQ